MTLLMKWKTLTKFEVWNFNILSIQIISNCRWNASFSQNTSEIRALLTHFENLQNTRPKNIPKTMKKRGISLCFRCEFFPQPSSPPSSHSHLPGRNRLFQRPGHQVRRHPLPWQLAGRLCGQHRRLHHIGDLEPGRSGAGEWEDDRPKIQIWCYY